MNNNYLDYLQHHGIKGQKWGVRRFRRKDGSLTPAGKNRYSGSEEGENHSRLSTNAKIAIGAGAAAAALGVLALTNPSAVKKIAGSAGDFLSKNGSKAVSALKKGGSLAAEKAKKLIDDNKDKVAEGIKKKLKEVGKSMGNTAMASISALVAAKAVDLASKKLATNETDSEAKKAANKVILDATKAGINAALNTSGNNSSGKNRPHLSGTEIASKLGPPSNGNLDRSSDRYRNLFVKPDGSHRDPETRAMIKSLANNGYDIDQIEKYLDEFAHADGYTLGIHWLEINGFIL